MAATNAAAQAQSTIETRYTSIWPDDCVMTASGGDEIDYVDYRCAGEGQDVELHFHDGVRLSISFAPDLMLYGLREKNWPVEWRGRMVSGRFVPHAAIARMYAFPDSDRREGSSYLAVFKVGGQSCSLGSADTNEQARTLADRGVCGRSY